MSKTSTTWPMTGTADSRAVRRQNLKVVVGLVAIIAAMGTLVYYAVPLYRLFCQATGYGGTTQVAAAAPRAVTAAPITVRFDTNVAKGLPWRFTPPKPVEIRAGEESLVAFSAVNLGSDPVLGTATFNVTPLSVGQYFNKIECFCFTEQLLMPGERKEFPVTFFIDPAITEDRDTRNIGTITLSYTFFNKGQEALEEYVASHETKATKLKEDGDGQP